MSKRKGNFESDPINPDSIESSGKNDNPRKRVAHKRAAPRVTPVLYVAKVKEPAGTNPLQFGYVAADVDDGLLAKIKKCLDRGHHHSASELESKTALFIATRMMEENDVTEAQILEYTLSTSRKYFAGQTVVAVTRRDGDSAKPVHFQTYLEILCEAIRSYFSCKFYSTTKPRCLELSFYGIVENTAAAALGLETAYNTISEWATSYRGTASKNSYSLGASEGLVILAEKERDRQEKQARASEAAKLKAKLKQEIAERKAQVARLGTLMRTDANTFSSSSSESSSSDGHESDDDPEPGVDADFDVRGGETFGTFEDLDAHIEKVTHDKARPSSSAPRWSSSIQLQTYRQMSDQIADNYFTQNNIKPTPRRARASTHPCDMTAYKQGKKDSKKIDLRRNRLE
ncbi:hypothetical protein MMC10_005784 [Thelotrema lepadinum]|nr:hypothetical protein [Thelotrema lepadinum]